jgi:hypothetical protein
LARGIDAAEAIEAAAGAAFSAEPARSARAADAAYAVARAGDAAFSVDAAALERGEPPANLAHAALWLEASPKWAEETWDRGKALLAAANEGWEVWIDWYEARLRGEPADPALWEKVVLIPDADWEKGAAHVNKRIKEIIEEHEAGAGEAPEADAAVTGDPPALPVEPPSPAHFEFRDGAIRPSPRPPTSPPGATTESAWRGVREALEDFAERGGGREVGVLRVVARCRIAMGERFVDLDVTLLGVHAGRLAEFARRADEVLLAEDAADLIALDRALSTFVAQFEAWRRYIAAIEEPFAGPAVEQKAVDDAAAAIDALRKAAPEIISPEALEILDPLREAAQRHPSADEPAPVAPAIQRRSFLRAAGSFFLSIGNQIVVLAREGVSKGVVKSFETATVAAIAGGAGYLFALAAGLPGEFAWLAALVSYALRLTGKSP